MLRDHAPHCRIGYDMVDFHAERMRKGADLSGDQAEREAATEMAIIEQALFETSDIVFAISEPERLAVLALVPSANVHVLPNAFELRSKTAPGVAGRASVAFLGGYWHTPNKDAVRWFVDEIWPIVRGLRPTAELRLGGSNMTDEIKALSGRDGIVALGQVDDINEFYDTARIAIAPLRYGAGMKGKVGQALAYGVPVVSTSVGIEGMDIINGEHALVADDAAGFAAAIVRLLDEDALWTRMSKAGPALIQATLSPAAPDNALRSLHVGDRKAFAAHKTFFDAPCKHVLKRMTRFLAES